MKIASPYRCDYCGALKGEANHWFLRSPQNNQFLLVCWDATLADTLDVQHICSESCAAKALSMWMAAQKEGG